MHHGKNNGARAQNNDDRHVVDGVDGETEFKRGAPKS